MNPIDPRRLAQLRPEKLSDTTIQQQIALIEKTYENVDPDLIAMIFHECDYNFQKTIARIQSEDYQNGGWKMAKSNNKKKHSTHSNAPVEILPNGNHSTNPENLNTSTNSTLPTSATKTTSVNVQPAESSTASIDSVDVSTSNAVLESTPNVTVSVESSSENETKTSLLPSTDPESLNEQPKSSSLRIETNRKKVPSLSSINSTRSKRHPPSAIPIEPVSIHRAIPRVSKSINVQFGDIQWIDSKPIAVPATEQSSSNIELDHQTSPTMNRDPSNQDQVDDSLAQATERVSLVSDEASTKLLPSTNKTDFDSSSTSMPHQYPVQQSISHTQSTVVLPVQGSNLASPTLNGMHTFVPNPMQETNTEVNTFPLVPSHPTPHYPPHPVEHPQNSIYWNSSPSTNKQSLKPTMTVQTNYLHQPMYQYTNPPAPQYQIPAVQYSTPLVPVFFAGEVSPYHFAQMQQFEAFHYGAPNYSPIYTNPPAYQPGMKYSVQHQDQPYQMSLPQARPIENDVNYGPTASSGSFQSNKELLANSNLSVTAAPFPPGAANPTTYVSPYQDGRFTTPHPMSNPRVNQYPSEQSQRAYSSNPSHSNRHLQQ